MILDDPEKKLSRKYKRNENDEGTINQARDKCINNKTERRIKQWREGAGDTNIVDKRNKQTQESTSKFIICMNFESFKNQI